MAQKSKRRRGARPPTAIRSAKARPPQQQTLTLAKFRSLLCDPISSDGTPPVLQSVLESRRSAIKDGDLQALFNALQRCLEPRRRGFSFETPGPDSDLKSDFNVSEVPSWLLGEVLMLLWSGLGGEWPQSKRRAAARLEAWKDVVRAWKVLRAREEGVPWDDVFARVAADLQNEQSPKTIEAAYGRVAANLRADPDFYRRIGPFPIAVLDFVATLPRSDS